MVTPFLGEIRITPYNSLPKGWAFCDGQQLPINQNQALFSIIGRTYGGDDDNFNLPDFRGRVPVGMGTGQGLTPRTMGQTENSTASSPASASNQQPYLPVNFIIALVGIYPPRV